MNHTYAEAGYKSKRSGGIILAKTIIIVVTILLVFIIVFSQVTGLAFVGGLLILVEYYGFARMKAEYEVIYCDGQFDFDKISGSMGRKTLFQIDMEQVDLIAPYEHQDLNQYREIPVKKKMIPGKAEESYVIVCSDKNGELRKILFQPTEKMLDCIYYKAPSKLRRRAVELEENVEEA